MRKHLRNLIMPTLHVTRGFALMLIALFVALFSPSIALHWLDFASFVDSPLELAKSLLFAGSFLLVFSTMLINNKIDQDNKKSIFTFEFAAVLGVFTVMLHVIIKFLVEGVFVMMVFAGQPTGFDEISVRQNIDQHIVRGVVSMEEKIIIASHLDGKNYERLMALDRAFSSRATMDELRALSSPKTCWEKDITAQGYALIADVLACEGEHN